MKNHFIFWIIVDSFFHMLFGAAAYREITHRDIIGVVMSFIGSMVLVFITIDSFKGFVEIESLDSEVKKLIENLKRKD